jgi:hypothetical protein
MAKSVLLEKFIQETDNPLLQELLKVFCESMDQPNEECVNLLVTKLEDIFEEQINANRPA